MRSTTKGRRSSRWVRHLACALTAASMIFAGSTARADSARDGRATTQIQEHRAVAGSADQDQLFRDLQSCEDEKLETRAAGEWSDSEVLLVVLLLIFLFPVGVIVLIVLLCTDGM